MEKILHPVSGEVGFFVPETEKKVIDFAVLIALNETSSDARGEEL